MDDSNKGGNDVITTDVSPPPTTVTTTSTTSNSTTTSAPSYLKQNERTVGIRCFLGKSEPFSGVLKQRYNDFIVNEIDLDGKVTRLENITPQTTSSTSTTTTTNNTEQQQSKEEEKKKEEEVKKDLTISDCESLVKLVGEEETKSFLEFYNGKSKTDSSSSFMFKADTDKDRRTQVHQVMKEAFGLVSQTDNSCVKVFAQCNKKLNNSQRNQSRGWPKDRPKYLQFVLFKENKESMDAIVVLSSQLRIKSNLFSIAGTKDKRGITVQHCTVFKHTEEQMLALNSKLFSSIRVGGSFKYVDDHLRLGDLTGNRFTVVIRDVNASDELIKESVQSLDKTGFINYYGMQRFGTGSVATHHVGIEIIKGNYEKAVELILYPREGERPELEKARIAYKENKNIDALLNALPKFMVSERKILYSLKKDRNYTTALQSIPRTLRMLYPHSYQSYIWNRMASERIERFGFDKPILGDLVAVNKIDSKKQKNDGDEEQQVEAGGEEDVDDIQDDDYQVSVVTEQDIKENKYSIDQVVLPMPTIDIQYPKNEIGELYITTMKEDGIDKSMFAPTRSKIYNLRGSYRKLISRASDLEYKIYRYDDVTIPLVLTDYDKLIGKSEPVDIPEGKYKALVLSFNLQSSCYATMVYRELLKQSSDLLQQYSLMKSQQQPTTTTSTTSTTSKDLKRKHEDIDQNETNSDNTSNKEKKESHP